MVVARASMAVTAVVPSRMAAAARSFAAFLAAEGFELRGGGTSSEPPLGVG